MACLLSERGWGLQPGDFDPALQRRLLQSMAANNFWAWLGQPTPDPLPTTFADDPFLTWAGRQVGDEQPLYYAALTPVCRLPLGLPFQVHLMRLISGCFYAATVLAVWWAVRGVWPAERAPVIAAAAAVAGLPMLAFIGGAVNNDSLALLLSALACGGLIRLVRRPNWRMAVAAVLAAVLAAVTKKTAAFLVLLVGLGCIWVLWGARRRLLSRAGLAGVLAVLAVASALWMPSKYPYGWTGRWQPLGWGLVASAAHGGGSGVRVLDATVQDSGRVVQILPTAALPNVRGQTLRFGAWVRAEGASLPVRVTIRDDFGLSQTFAEATPAWQWLSVIHSVHPGTKDVRVTVAIGGTGDPAAAVGVIDVDDASLVAVAQTDAGAPTADLLRNGNFEQGARAVTLLLDTLVRPWLAKLRADVPPASWQRSLLYLALLFPGFWGNFGWLQVRMPIAVYVLLAGVCGLALAGILVPGREGGIRSLPGSIAGWLGLGLALAVFQIIVLPMWGRDWQPQARYLMTALVPILVFFIVGLRRWSVRWRLAHALHWYLAGFVCLDVYALVGLIVPHYYFR